MKLITYALLFAALSCAASAQTTEMTGKWKATWLNGGTPNILQLTETNGVLAGAFLADGGESCPVAGTHREDKVSLHVTCAAWQIEMNGKLTEDGVAGDYSAYGNVSGAFKMEKMICMLPEGCGSK